MTADFCLGFSVGMLCSIVIDVVYVWYTVRFKEEKDE